MRGSPALFPINPRPWGTSSPGDPYPIATVADLGFIVDRRSFLEGIPTEWLQLGSYLENPALVGQGSTTRQTTYTFLDRSAQTRSEYEYRLADVDYRQQRHDHSQTVLSSRVEPVAQGFELKQNYPNPFNPSTTIQLLLPQAGVYHVLITDIQGRSIRLWTISAAAAGTQGVQWDGRDAEGRAVSSGEYLVQIRQGDRTRSRKMLLLR